MWKDIEIFGIKLTLAPYYETSLLGPFPFGCTGRCSRCQPRVRWLRLTVWHCLSVASDHGTASVLPLLPGMGCEITTCSFVTAPLTSHSQLVPDRRKELFLFVTGPRIQIHAYLPKTRFEPSMTHSSSADLEESMIDTKETSEEYKMKMIYCILWAVCMFASTLTKELYDQDLLEEVNIVKEVFDLQDKATSSQYNSLGLKDISVDINEDTILEFTHLQIVTSLLETDDGSVEDDRVLEGDYKVISNSVNHPFDANDEGHFSIPFHFILRAKNLEMALINKVLHSSGAPLSSTARQALKKYMKAFLKTQYNTIASIKTLNQNARPLIDSDKEISRNGEADDWLAMPMIYRNLKNTNLNEVVDFLLGIVKNDILEKGKDLLNIPDIHKDFGTGEGTSMIKGTFTATKGWIKSISTIQRTADVILNRVGETVSVTCGLGLKVLEFGYDNYTIMAVGYHTTGTMAGSIGNNSVDLKVSLALVSTGCNATLNELKFSGSDFKISLTGLGEFSFIVSDVTTWFAELFKTHISASIGKHIQESIENTLQKFHCNHLS
uniref:Uncharacterized protein n=1 Tax=Timema shepardi TaxID=629360 RepID=A0A7R9FZ09_TIMSH|nr:unnamed protein product [Timema shepardi]